MQEGRRDYFQCLDSSVQLMFMRERDFKVYLRSFLHPTILKVSQFWRTFLFHWTKQTFSFVSWFHNNIRKMCVIFKNIDMMLQFQDVKLNVCLVSDAFEKGVLSKILKGIFICTIFQQFLGLFCECFTQCRLNKSLSNG